MRLERHKKEALQHRILRNIKVDEESRCWIWQRARNSAGYGYLNMRIPRHRRVLAHRLAYHVFRRRPPRDRQVAHDYRCISRLCVNPMHLRATTQSANERDKKRTLLWERRQLRELCAVTHFMEGR